MSRSFPGEQVEHAFRSHRLCNWEVPKKEQKVSAESPFGTLKPRPGRTTFITDDRGYLLKGRVKDTTASFNHKPQVYEKTFARWPQTSNPAIPSYSCATMGYKGITTNYLPSNTVTIKAVEGPQITRFDRTLPSKPLTKYTGEYNYNFM